MKTHALFPFQVYSKADLKKPALDKPKDGDIAYARDRYGRAVQVVWSAVVGSYVDPIYLLRLIPSAA